MRTNFAWIFTWKITHRCNLSCTYCDHRQMLSAGAKESPRYRETIERIVKFAPKIVNISGGEPTLVTELPGIVAELKTRFNPYIRIVHNGTQPTRTIPLFPYIDRLVISIDGPGELNRRTRGIDGDKVIERLAGVIDEAVDNGVEPAVNCVVTRANVLRIEELVEKIHAVSPRIVVSFSPLIPPTADESIVPDASLRAHFEQTVASLQSAGRNVIHTFDSLLRHKNFSCIQCYNQFFVVRATPEGKISACPMNVPLSMVGRGTSLRRIFSQGGFRRAITGMGKALKSRVDAPVDFSCSTMCNCESWLDMLFLGKRPNAAEVYLRGLHGRMSERDYRELDEFVRNHINENFDIAAFKNAVEGARPFSDKD